MGQTLISLSDEPVTRLRTDAFNDRHTAVIAAEWPVTAANSLLVTAAAAAVDFFFLPILLSCTCHCVSTPGYIATVQGTKQYSAVSLKHSSVH